MAETSIEWTQRSWNPIVGCSLASPGCTNCYAMAMARRIEMMGTAAHYVGLTRQTRAGAVWTGKLALAPEHVLTEPLRRRKPTTWFVNSMGDLFHEDVPDAWIDRIFAVMALCPQHTFQILTKRAGRMRAYMLEKWQGTPAHTISLGKGVTLAIPAGGPTGRLHQVEQACEPLLEQFGLADTEKDGLWTEDGKCIAMQWQWPLPNVWLGVSAEDQRRADERIPDLLETPAAVRFVSAEPLLGPIEFRHFRCDETFSPDSDPRNDLDALTGEVSNLAVRHTERRHKLDWIIVGGESGPNARPMHPDWARSIRDQCAAAGTAFFFKQWGEHLPGHYSQSRYTALLDPSEGPSFGINLGPPPHAHVHEWGDDCIAIRVGKKRAGRLLDGAEHNAMPGGRDA